MHLLWSWRYALLATPCKVSYGNSCYLFQFDLDEDRYGTSVRVCTNAIIYKTNQIVCQKYSLLSNSVNVDARILFIWKSSSISVSICRINNRPCYMSTRRINIIAHRWNWLKKSPETRNSVDFCSPPVSITYGSFMCFHNNPERRSSINFPAKAN